MKKRTKIICTVGPACDSSAMLKKMIKAGMDVARLNFSHGSHANHRTLYRNIRAAAKAVNKHVPIIADLQGPKIRIGELPSEGMNLRSGEDVIFSTNEDAYKKGYIPVTYKDLHVDVKATEHFLIDDGLLEVQITKVKGDKIYAHVLNGGKITSHKGMNFPESKLAIPAFTKKDKLDAEFAANLGADWVVLSFVTSVKDVMQLRRFLKAKLEDGKVFPKVMVKIEKPEALEEFDSILKVVDGVMIGRGDLAIETPAEEVPIRQKEIITKCRQVGKPVIVATQMLQSMTENPRPTRAEVSDVANAVFDSSDAVMLSAESATGKFPLETVSIMANIIKKSEDSIYDDIPLISYASHEKITALSDSIKLIVLRGEIDCVIASFELAPWSASIFRSHPEIPFYLVTPNKEIARQESLRWGVQSVVMKNIKETTFVKRAITLLKKQKKIKNKMRIAVVMGDRHGEGYDVVVVK